jgi:hypothetical protein
MTNISFKFVNQTYYFEIKKQAVST